MAQLDSNIVLKAFATPQLDIAGTLQGAEDRKRQMMIQKQQDAALAQQQQDKAATRGVIRQYGTDPRAARQAAFQTGNPELVAKLDSMDEAARKRTIDVARGTAPLVLSLRKVAPEQTAQAIAQLAPELQARGWSQDHIAQVAQQLADPAQREAAFAAIESSAQTIEEYAKARAPYILNEGDRRFDGDNQMIAEGAPKFHAVTTPAGGTTTIFGAPGGQGGASVEAMLPAIVQQESRGNYSARNSSTGAMGAYQVMPATAKTLAERLGLPWRPELMTAATADGRRYQDAIGHAAVSEAVEASGGDPAVAAAYYHGGSDQSKWGPKTRQYAQEVIARIGRQGGPMTIKGQPKPVSAAGGGKPPAGYRFTPDGNLEPIPGGPADKAKAPAKDAAYSQSAMDAFDRAIASGERLLKHPGFAARVGSGFDPAAFGSMNPFTGKPFAGTNAADFAAELAAMKAQVFLPMVQSMKGMGALSNAEGERLTAAIGALDVNMSEAAFASSMKRIIGDLNTYKTRSAGNAPAPQQQQRGPVKISGDADYAKLPSGAQFVGPDGKLRRKP